MEAPAADHRGDLIGLYDRAVGEVHGYLARRCPASDADDLTAETFMAAVDSIERGAVDRVTTAWLVGIARHKLVDHWRRLERDQRRLRAVEGTLQSEDDPWDPVVDRRVADETLARLKPMHRLVLSLKYLDELPVAEIAGLIERSPNGVEALLTRAKAEFRVAYNEGVA